MQGGRLGRREAVWGAAGSGDWVSLPSECELCVQRAAACLAWAARRPQDQLSAVSMVFLEKQHLLRR